MSMPLAYRVGDLGDPRSLIGPLTGPQAEILDADIVDRSARQNARWSGELGWGITVQGELTRYARLIVDPQLVRDVAVFQRSRGLRVDGVIGPATLDEMRKVLWEWHTAGRPRDHYGTWIARYLRIPGRRSPGIDSRIRRGLLVPDRPRFLWRDPNAGVPDGFSVGQAGAAEDGGAEDGGESGLSTGAKVAIGAGGLAALAALVLLARKKRKKKRGRRQ